MSCRRLVQDEESFIERIRAFQKETDGYFKYLEIWLISQLRDEVDRHYDPGLKLLCCIR